MRRLSLYLRFLEEADGNGVSTISSDELAQRGGTTSAQVRKDLSVFGSFGKRGLGYSVPELLEAIREILGLGDAWRVALIGAGKIGAALFSYRPFQERGFHIHAVFDSDPAKIGERWGDLCVRDDAHLEQVLAEQKIDIAIVAVPGEAAQAVVDRLAGAGIRGILNFAPVPLHAPGHVPVRNVDMVVELEGLSFALHNG